MLTLDEQTHQYRQDGRRVPGVHDCLDAACFIDDRWYTDEAKYRGSYVDQACYLITRGTLNRNNIRPSFRHQIAEFDRFLSDTGFKVLRAKWRGYHTVWGYAGELDFYGQFPHLKTPDVIDLKATDSEEDWWKLQTAAYAELIKEDTGQRPGRAILRLPRDGRYSIRRHDDRNDLKVFLACVTIAKRKGLPS